MHYTAPELFVLLLRLRQGEYKRGLPFYHQHLTVNAVDWSLLGVKTMIMMHKLNLEPKLWTMMNAMQSNNRFQCSALQRIYTFNCRNTCLKRKGKITKLKWEHEQKIISPRLHWLMIIGGWLSKWKEDDGMKDDAVELHEHQLHFKKCQLSEWKSSVE